MAHPRNFSLCTLMLVVLALSTACSNQSDRPAPTPESVNVRVIVLGMVHNRHLDSEKYSLPFLKRTIETIKPDYILTEIPPDRFDEAITGFRETGKVTEPRVARFPEYVDVIIPLTNEMPFEIIPTAAWTAPMAEFRTAALNKLARDETRADDWQSYTAALDAMNEKLKGREDDPFFIHTDPYDAIIKTGLAPYASLFAGELGTGDWEQINRAHYELIASALGRITRENHPENGTDITVLITFGAAHKYWFLEQLRTRNDIRIISPLPYLEMAAAKPVELP